MVDCCSTMVRRFSDPARSTTPNQGKPQRKLVADHLCLDAQRAQQRIFVVRRPAGKRDAVNADGSDAEDHQQADIHIGDLEQVDAVPGDARAERNDGNRNQRAAKRKDGRQNVERRSTWWASCLL
jgi:hypothetical protein